MKQTRWIGGVAALALAAGAATAAQSSTQQSTSGQAAAARKIVVTGCLRSVDPAAGAAAATTASTVQFVLADARMTTGTTAAGAGAAAGAGTTGTSGTPAAQSTGAAGTNPTRSTYILLTENIEQLRSHSNHQVEVTGTLDSAERVPVPTPAVSAPAGSTSPAASAPGRQEAQMGQRLRVDAVQMITASCTQG